MCLAIPGRIISIDETGAELKTAKVSFAGIVKEVCIQWIDAPKIGDYVLVHAGFALNKVDEKAAEETLRILQDPDNAIEAENIE
jgi:hydrogenase expression/formation protein HypC